jgi:hypothetical protein
MRVHTIGTAIGLAILAGCGGDAPDPLPILGGDVEGSYAGNPFVGEFGFATLYDDVPIVGIGDGDLHCGSPRASAPPSGRNALIAVPEFAIATYSNVLVNLYENVDEYTGYGSNAATVEITAVSPDAIAGTVSYDVTSAEGDRYSLAGSFEVTRCAD